MAEVGLPEGAEEEAQDKGDSDSNSESVSSHTGSSMSGYSSGGKEKKKRRRPGHRGGVKHKRKTKSPPRRTGMRTRSSPVGPSHEVPWKPSKQPSCSTVVEEETPLPVGDTRRVVVGPKAKAPPGGWPVTFQVPTDSLREVPQNPNLVLGEGEGSLPATPGKGLDLSALPRLPDSSPEGEPEGRMSGVASQESSPGLDDSPQFTLEHGTPTPPKEQGKRPATRVASKGMRGDGGGASTQPEPTVPEQGAGAVKKGQEPVQQTPQPTEHEIIVVEDEEVIPVTGLPATQEGAELRKPAAQEPGSKIPEPSPEELEAAREAAEELRPPRTTEEETVVATDTLEEINRNSRTMEEVNRYFGHRDPFGTPRMCFTPRGVRGPLALVGVGRGQSPAPGLGAGQGRVTGLNTPNFSRSPAGNLRYAQDLPFRSLYEPQNYRTLMDGGLLSSPVMVESLPAAAAGGPEQQATDAGRGTRAPPGAPVLPGPEDHSVTTQFTPAADSVSTQLAPERPQDYPIAGWILLGWFPTPGLPPVRPPLEAEEIEDEVWVGRGQAEQRRASTVRLGGHTYSYRRTWRLLGPRQGEPLPSIERMGPPPPLEGFQPVLIEGRMSRKRTGPRWCTVTMDVEYHYLPISEDPLGEDAPRGGR